MRSHCGVRNPSPQHERCGRRHGSDRSEPSSQPSMAADTDRPNHKLVWVSSEGDNLAHSETRTTSTCCVPISSLSLSLNANIKSKVGSKTCSSSSMNGQFGTVAAIDNFHRRPLHARHHSRCPRPNRGLLRYILTACNVLRRRAFSADVACMSASTKHQVPTR